MIDFQTGSEQKVLTDAWEFSKSQVRRLVETHPDFYPMYTAAGKWKHDGEAWTHWCDGFLPGMMWIIYAREMNRDAAGARWWRTQAIRYSTPLEPRKLDRDVHDLGFIFMSTYWRWFQLTGDPSLKAVILEAGSTLAKRFKEKGEYLRSFVSDDSLFIDIMMNVGIIFHTAIETKDAALMDVAMRHTLTSRRVLVRGDGSTSHEGMYDLQSGEFLKQTTHQGYRGDSCWSRGLAWALYGFATSFGFTRDSRFLEVSELCAKFFIENTPPDGVAPWDYDAPSQGPLAKTQVDTSASAIAASGLFQLAKVATDPVRGAMYRACALRIVDTLSKHHLAVNDPNWEGILKGGVYHIHKGLGVDESVMWGEHFYMEALDAAIG